MTWPLISRLGTHIPGEGQDHVVHLWTYWWVKKALIEGLNPLFTTFLYYPNGVSLTTHNIAWLNIALWLPLQALIGEIAAATMLYLVAFTLNGFAMYLLVYEWTESAPAAFIGGVIFGFWPYLVYPGGWVYTIFLFWLPLSLLFLKRTFDYQRKRDAVISGVFLAAVGLTIWQLLILGGLLGGLYSLYRLVTDATCRTKQTLINLVIIAMVALIIIAPLALPVILSLINQTNIGELLSGDPAEDQANLLGYIVPSPALTSWGNMVSQIPENLRIRNTDTSFVGFTVMALAIIGTWHNWRKARFWLAAALIYFALALGTQLKIGDQLYPNLPMPYRLIEDFFLVQVIREPSRFNIILGIPVAMLAGFGVVEIIRRPRLARWSTLVIGILSVMILMEYKMVPYSTRHIKIPAWYATLAQEPGEFGVFDLPLDSRDHDKMYMLFQRTHGKPLVAGHVSRLSQEAFSFLDSTQFLKNLRPDSVMDPRIFNVSHQLKALADANVRYLILHKNRVDNEAVTAWRNWLVFEPYHEDEDLIVYRTDPQLGRDFELSQELTEEFGIIDARFWPEKLGPGGFLQVAANWGSKSQIQDDHDACIQLADDMGSIIQAHCGLLAPSWPTSHWEANELVRDYYIMHLDPDLSPGNYTVQLAIFESSTGVATGQPAVLGELIVDDSLGEGGEDSDPENILGANWGDLFNVIGYDLTDSPDQLDITFYWRAERPTDISYKVFVHLIDAVTGSVVAQADYIPRNWTYPTNLWQPGEIIRDSVELSLEDVPPGTFRLQFGLYDPDTGKRREVYSSDGAQYPNDAVPIGTFQRDK